MSFSQSPAGQCPLCNEGIATEKLSILFEREHASGAPPPRTSSFAPPLKPLAQHAWPWSHFFLSFALFLCVESALSWLTFPPVPGSNPYNQEAFRLIGMGMTLILFVFDLSLTIQAASHRRTAQQAAIAQWTCQMTIWLHCSYCHCHAIVFLSDHPETSGSIRDLPQLLMDLSQIGSS